MERVVITGVGAISALGEGADVNFQEALSGNSGISFLIYPYAERLGFDVAAQILRPLPALIPKTEAALFDRVSLLALASANEAYVQSGLSVDAEQATRSSVFWGTGVGGVNTMEVAYEDILAKNKGRTRPMTVVASMNSAAAAHIAIKLGFGGCVNTYSSACVSSAQAIGEAFRHIQHGYAERAIAGGSEALLTHAVLSSWDALRVIAKTDATHPERTCKPFSRKRNGLVLGEGSAAIVLESLSSAQTRGATILAELVGYGASNDATHITKPDPAGQARAIHMALAEAQLPPSGIDYINAHGAGTVVGDAVETASIKAVFGEYAKSIMVSSTKAVHGHTLGAGGALEFVITLLALRANAVPPTAFLEDPDPECELDYVPLQARYNQALRAVMSNSFAFGGSNVALIAQKFKH